MLVKYNFTKGANNPLYIVVHDTGNPGATAYNHYQYFNGGNRGASAHYFVDDKDIIQIINDYDAAWHCGDGNGIYGITNFNSIGIEMCLTDNMDKVTASTVDLIVELMQEWDIPIERVVRHYDASRKSCPNHMASNNWSKWWAFKERVKKRYEQDIAGTTGIEEVEQVAQTEQHWVEANGTIKVLADAGITFQEKRYDEPITRAEAMQIARLIVEAVK